MWIFKYITTKLQKTTNALEMVVQNYFDKEERKNRPSSKFLGARYTKYVYLSVPILVLLV